MRRWFCPSSWWCHWIFKLWSENSSWIVQSQQTFIERQKIKVYDLWPCIILQILRHYSRFKFDLLHTCGCHTRKTIGKIKLLSRMALYMPEKLCIELYKSLIHPHLDYGDVIFDCLSPKDFTTLPKLQNMAIRNILHVPKRTPTLEIHERVKLEMVHTRCWCRVATDMFKVSSNLVPKTVPRNSEG